MNIKGNIDGLFPNIIVQDDLLKNFLENTPITIGETVVGRVTHVDLISRMWSGVLFDDMNLDLTSLDKFTIEKKK